MRGLIVVAILVGGGVPSGAASQPGFGARTVDRRLTEIQTETAQVMSQMETDEQHRVRATAERVAIQEQRRRAQARVRDRARGLYRMTRAGMLPIAGGFPALLGHASRTERLERMVQADLGSLEALAARERTLNAETARLTTIGEEQRRRLRELRSESVALEAERHSAALFGDVFTQTTVASTTNNYGSALGLGNFAGNEGRLVLPVAGAMHIVDSDDRTSLSFRVRPGTGVRSVAQGRVVYAQAYGAQGNLVVLDHGDGYFSVYRGLAAIGVQVGDWLGEGTRLGEVAFGQDGLWFEIRNGTRPLSARRWLGL